MARKKSQSPQARWARKKKKAGMCARCGEKRNKYKQLCDFHQGQQTEYMRQRRAKEKNANTGAGVRADSERIRVV